MDWSREGNGTPLQYSCLENPRDGGAWWAAISGSHRVGHDWSNLAAAAAAAWTEEEKDLYSLKLSKDRFHLDEMTWKCFLSAYKTFKKRADETKLKCSFHKNI